MRELPLITQNTLFQAMPTECKERILPEAKLVSLQCGTVLTAPDLPVTHIYFPIDAIVALVYLVDDGSSSEVSVIGNEGMVGIFSMLSDENSSNEAQVLSAGYAFSVPKKVMQAEFATHDCGILMLRYIQSLFAQMSQTAVCNRHHTIDQQLCRLLLLSLDRLPCNNLTMTHDLISRMLGVRRGGISEAASRLQKNGVIDYHRGHIKVLDRSKLERLSCECYLVVKRQTDKLLPPKKMDEPEFIRPDFRLIPGAESRCSKCFRFHNCIYLKHAKSRRRT